jgi:hypothetical protein
MNNYPVFSAGDYIFNPHSFDEITNVAGECTCLLEAAYLIQKKKYPGRDGREK